MLIFNALAIFFKVSIAILLVSKKKLIYGPTASIFSKPSDKDSIEICFKRILNGPGTSFLFSLKPNDKVEFFGPLGAFKVDTNLMRKNLICISAGTGVVPFRSIILNLLESGFDKNIILLSGHKDENSAINYNEFKELESKFSNFKYYPALSEFNKEHVQDIVKKVVKKDFDGDFYLCGKLEMIEEVVEILNKIGFEEDRIHLESYN